jgi:hypothetical protein
MTACLSCPRAATHENGGCWEHCDGTPLRFGAECEHGGLARKCDRCEAAQEIAELRARIAAAGGATRVMCAHDEPADECERCEVAALRARAEKAESALAAPAPPSAS